MNLTELISFLNGIGANPKKALSQNFLIDANITSKIVRTAEVNPSDTVLEIGCGPGALTQKLLEAGAKVIAVEKDPIFADAIRRFQTPDSRLFPYHADFLKFPLESLPSPLKVVANLPYHITTPILEKLFAAGPLFTSLTLMVQKEVADRMAASSGSKLFGSLSIFVRFYTRVHSTFKVPAACFYPRPKVDSTVVRLDFCPRPSIDPDVFFPIVHEAFQQRRKMMSTSLGKSYPKEEIKRILISLSLPPEARPESVPFEKWVEFCQLLTTNGKSC